MSINIMLVDDHKITRDGLKSLIDKEDDMYVVAEAQNGREAVRKALEHSPFVIVMDINMPDLNGIEASSRILAELPETKIIALSMYSEKRYVAGMLKAGVKGYLLKSCAFDELVTAIHAVVKNQGYLSAKITGIIIQDYSNKLSEDKNLGSISSLTSKEKEVLQLIAEGVVSSEIADRLCVSIKTISTHRRHIMEKLNVFSVAGLTKTALRSGLISLDN